jgi:hypothetical protein
MSDDPPDPSRSDPAADSGDSVLVRRAIEQAMLAFGGSLRDLFRTLFGSERPAAGELVDRLAISRTLAWRLQQMAKPDDLAANLNAVVAERGFRVLVASLGSAGLPADRLAEIEARWEVLRRSMRRHRIDRDGLRSIGAQERSSVRGGSDAARRRRDAMRANEFLWGIGIRTTILTQMFARHPAAGSPDTDRIGLAASVIHHGLRVVRPVPPLVVYRRLFRGAFGESDPQDLARGDIAPWIDEACTPGICGTAVRPRASQKEAFELDTASIPTAVPIDLAFAESALDFASPYADSPGQSGFMEAPLGFPVERVIVYLGTHESMPEWSDHECRLRTALMTSRRLPPERRFATLPVDSRLEPIESVAGVPTLPSGSEHLEPMVRRIMSINAAALGHKPTSFRFRRLVLDHPPMPSLLLIRWRLAERTS